MDERTILQLVLLNETGDSYYRMRWPARELATQRPSWRIINLDALAKERHEWALEADLLVLFQSNDYDAVSIIHARRARGLKTLVEYNDNFYASQPWSPVAKEWSNPLLWQAYETIMNEADGLLVTGPGLFQLFSERISTDKIFILGNNVPTSPDPLGVLLNSKSHDTTVIGWAGSLGHIADLLAIAPTVQSALSTIPQSEFHVMGNEAIPRLLHIPQHQLRYTAWGSMDEYFAFWRPVHIGVIPLLDTEYNRCRSDIKAVEMIYRGVLPIIPDALPYHELLSKTGLKPYRTKDELLSQLLYYAQNPEIRAEILGECYRYLLAEKIGPARTERATLYERFRPATPQPCAIKLTAGYHEIKGSPHPQSKFGILAGEIQELLKKNDIEGAYAKVNSIPENERLWNPDILLLEGTILAKKGLPVPSSLFSNARARYPRDLRFLYVELLNTKDIDNTRIILKELYRKLALLTPRERTYFEKEVTRVIPRVVARFASSLEDALEYVTLFPDNAQLRLFFAEKCWSVGRDLDALAHYQWLADHIGLVKKNSETLNGLEEGYVLGLRDALFARLT